MPYGDYRDWLPGGAHVQNEQPNPGYVWRDPNDHGKGQIPDDYRKFTDPVWAASQQPNAGYQQTTPGNPGGGQTPVGPPTHDAGWYAANTGAPTTWQGQIYGRTGPNLGGDQASLARRYFGDLTGDQRNFYQSAEGMPYAWQKVAGQEAAPDSYYGRWLNTQEANVRGNFINASTADPNVQATDYYAQQMPGLAHRYLELPGWQQGKGQSVWYAGKQF